MPRVSTSGSQSPDAAGLLAHVWLGRQGYTAGTVRGMLKDLGQVGLWMSREGLREAHLDEAAMLDFLVASGAAGRRKVLGPRGMSPLLTYLREATGVTPLARPSLSPMHVLVGEYRAWMLKDRAWRVSVGPPASHPDIGLIDKSAITRQPAAGFGRFDELGVKRCTHR